MTLSGANVICGGYHYDGTKAIPCLWTSATPTDLPSNGANGAYVWTLTMSGGTVVSAGSYYNGTISVPCVWYGTNAPVSLPGDGSHSAEVISGWWEED